MVLVVVALVVALEEVPVVAEVVASGAVASRCVSPWPVHVSSPSSLPSIVTCRPVVGRACSSVSHSVAAGVVGGGTATWAVAVLRKSLSCFCVS